MLEDEVESLAEDVWLDQLVEIVDWDDFLSHRRVQPKYQLISVKLLLK